MVTLKPVHDITRMNPAYILNAQGHYDQWRYHMLEAQSVSQYERASRNPVKPNASSSKAVKTERNVMENQSQNQ